MANDSRPKRLDYAIAFLLALTVIAYWVWFARIDPRGAGDPASWGQFGDYVGGVTGTVIMALTLLFVADTLHVSRQALEATKKEADDTRRTLAEQTTQLEEQVKLLRKDARARDVHRKLDGTLQDWHRELETPVRGIYRYKDRLPHEDAKHRPRIDFFAENMRSHMRAVPPGDLDNFRTVHWPILFDALCSLIEEMNDYCDEYDGIAGNSSLTDYYRRRICRVASVLALELEILERSQLARATPKSAPH